MTARVTADFSDQTVAEIAQLIDAREVSAEALAVGLPAVFIPIGLAEGLPMSIQFIGPIGSDRTLMALAHAVQSGTEWHRLRPPTGAPT